MLTHNTCTCIFMQKLSGESSFLSVSHRVKTEIQCLQFFVCKQNLGHVFESGIENTQVQNKLE